MMTVETRGTDDAPVTQRPDVFARVLVGVDGSPEGVEAARQAGLLLEPAGRLTLATAYDVATAMVGGGGYVSPVYVDEEGLIARADEFLAEARAAMPELTPASGKRLRGRAWEELLHEVDCVNASVVAVGTHGTSRLRGIVLGSTATEIVHKAPCSVLIARKGVASPPETIVVGIDGSPESSLALEAARRLSRRFGARLWPVVAHGGKGADDAAVQQMLPGHRHEEVQDEPVTALTAAGAAADLVVVGSRGLHGFRALGSVSERVAHEAPCSVLVVR
jgi:nucleotide-binding universal stress UspA family protein